MVDTGTPPVIPAQFQQYNSYVVDPQWQVRFTIIWASVAAAAVVFSFPRLIHAFRVRRALVGFFGISEDWNYLRKRIPSPPRPSGDLISSKRRLEGFIQSICSISYWSLPGLELNAGQILLVACYLCALLVCIIRDAPLLDNPNRAGFLALAQFPVVFLFATKNSLLSLLLGPGNGYEKLNFLHRWSGRGMLVGAVVHGALWINNHIVYDLPILGQQKETSGVAALTMLCIVVLTSLKPVRKWFNGVFFVLHILSFVAFFVTVCYHTIYAPPWIYPPLALYGFDFLMRLLRVRIKDATLTPVGTLMTVIRVPFCDAGWTAGQHVRLRVFFGGRMLESHPLTILSAPPETSCLSTPGITLGARAVGDWTLALNSYANNGRRAITNYLLTQGEKVEESDVHIPVHVMIDGPYGGCSVDLGRYETVLLFAGGSGATFTIGLLDDIVGRCIRLNRKYGERTRRIQFAWCIRSFGALEWFAPMLMDIANTAAGSSIDLYISVYVTCLCNPEAIPSIPNCDVTLIRPSVYQVLRDLVTPPPASVKGSGESSSPRTDEGSKSQFQETVNEAVEVGTIHDKLRWRGVGGGVAVCASGPETLTREASNAVARLGLSRGIELGGIALHTELFSL
ncbi:iron reductase [Pluteus cervinus]|uniref:Iron reductase n=1 Tax=Pluteus cervinus TaxID=181527 RepID=A0ACD3BGR2_9AGAR|nr:iron reductase [Pluteus cervinus]